MPPSALRVARLSCESTQCRCARLRQARSRSAAPRVCNRQNQCARRSAGPDRQDNHQQQRSPAAGWGGTARSSRPRTTSLDPSGRAGRYAARCRRQQVAEGTPRRISRADAPRSRSRVLHDRLVVGALLVYGGFVLDDCALDANSSAPPSRIQTDVNRAGRQLNRNQYRGARSRCPSCPTSASSLSRTRTLSPSAIGT